jgi:hypothetical protein
MCVEQQPQNNNAGTDAVRSATQRCADETKTDQTTSTGLDKKQQNRWIADSTNPARQPLPIYNPLNQPKPDRYPQTHRQNAKQYYYQPSKTALAYLH